MVQRMRKLESEVSLRGSFDPVNLDQTCLDEGQILAGEVVPPKGMDFCNSSMTLTLEPIILDFSARLRCGRRLYPLFVNCDLNNSEVILSKSGKFFKDRIEISPSEVWFLAKDCKCSILRATANLTSVLVADHIMQDIRRRSLPLWAHEINWSSEDCFRASIMDRVLEEILPDLRFGHLE
jgi:hypothetical protein